MRNITSRNDINHRCMLKRAADRAKFRIRSLDNRRILWYSMYVPPLVGGGY